MRRTICGAHVSDAAADHTQQLGIGSIELFDDGLNAVCLIDVCSVFVYCEGMLLV
jgi:hypothetical protein